MAMSLSVLGESRRKALARYAAKQKKLKAKGAKVKGVKSVKVKANGKAKAAKPATVRKIKKAAKRLHQREPAPAEAALFGNSPE